MTIKLTPAQKKRILNADDIFTIMRDILLRDNKIDRNKEHLWLVCLSATNILLMIELVSLGSVYSTSAEPMDIFSFALQKRAVKLIMVHNHADGSLEPSRADYAITEKMFSIGKFVRIPVIDHLIISEESYYSFDDHGLMSRMEKDNKYDLTFAEQDRLLQQMERIELEKKMAIAEKKDAINKMVRSMLAHNVPIKEIMQSSGLTKKEIEQLKKSGNNT